MDGVSSAFCCVHVHQPCLGICMCIVAGVSGSTEHSASPYLHMAQDTTAVYHSVCVCVCVCSGWGVVFVHISYNISISQYVT